MIAFDGRQVQSLLALLGFVFCTFALSTRYYTSASFEHPFIFSISSLFISSLIAALSTRWSLHGARGAIVLVEAGYFPPQWHPTTITKRPLAIAISIARPALDLVSRVRRPFAVLLLCLVSRSCLFWYTLRHSQCAQVGVEAFLPFCVLLIDAAIRYWSRDYNQLESSPKSSPRQHWKSPVFLYGFLSLAWSVAAMFAADSARVKTGVICLSGKHLEAYTPYLQVVMCVMDGVIVAELSNLRLGPGDESVDISKFFSVLCLVASGLMAVIGGLVMSRSTQQLHLGPLAHRDLFADALMASVSIACAKNLLASLHPTMIAMLLTGLALFGYRFQGFDNSLVVPPLSRTYILQTTAITSGLAGAWFATAFYSKSASRSPTTILLHRFLVLGYLAGVAVLIVSSAFFSAENIHTSLPTAVGRLTRLAQSSAERWEALSSQSKTLEEAVAEYQTRHFMPPPPNFDKWYEFATERNSSVIDTFGQIFNDLVPFWGIEPSEIRARTAHLFEFPELGMAALQIRNGTLRQSPHIPGTHHWMTDSIEKMMEPFIQFLPDMDFVINLADECRTMVPYQDIWDLRSSGRQRQADMANRWEESQETRKAEGGFVNSWRSSTDWPEDFPEPRKNADDSFAMSPDFADNIRKQLYYEWIAATCPPDSPARNGRWWDWSTLCLDCVRPHSDWTTDGIVMARNPGPQGICYQPDLAYLNGFIRSQTQATTKKLFPIFSQARVDGFQDILFPSPWNFVDKTEYREDTDKAWGQKENSLFWRGSSSDGIARDGAWKGFLRARAVHESYEEVQRRHGRTETTARVNVSFAGEIHRCDSPDCGNEFEMFNFWSGAVKPEDPSYVKEGDEPDLHKASAPFEEHWNHRHLLDMDGAGFSGRFIPFLESHGLPYRAGLFFAWFDERLQEWYHYVPVDTRLGRGFWSVLDFLSGNKEVVDESGAKRTGSEMAHRIAEQGRDWAKKALRKEDMQIYMFRLLLEYGRVVDDERESLGYTGNGRPTQLA